MATTGATYLCAYYKVYINNALIDKYQMSRYIACDLHGRLAGQVNAFLAVNTMYAPLSAPLCRDWQCDISPYPSTVPQNIF